jgi:RNA polymerase sigma factor (TIGR02999 family)
VRTVPSSADLTGLLHRWSEGDQRALEDLIPLVYGELRRLAARELRHEDRGHTLAPTALVHELYFRLVDQRQATWASRAQFYGVAAQLMRRILIDHARARQARKRGGSATMVSLEGLEAGAAPNAIATVLAVDEALERLAARDPEQARLVELRFFAGLTVEEAAHVLGRSPRTVKREWRLARAWLFRELRSADRGSAG